MNVVPPPFCARGLLTTSLDVFRGVLNGSLAVPIYVDQPRFSAIPGDQHVVHVVEIKGLAKNHGYAHHCL